MDEMLWFLGKTDNINSRGYQKPAWLVTHLYISVSLATCLFFRELANLFGLERWLRIPPIS